MNGRIYDPIIARFISADPHIDGLYSTQGLNSYSYVHNNPLSATDPSGYFLKKIFKGVKKALSGLNKIAKSIRNEMYRPLYKVIRALGPVAQPLVAVGSIICTGAYAACVAAGNYHIAKANGASTMQGLRIGAVSGAIAYAGAYAADAIGNVTTTLVNGAYTMSAGQAIANVALHGVRGGVTAAISGGDFRSGFLAGSFGAFGDVTKLSGDYLVGSAVFGGVGAKLGGGDFAEGAVIAVIGKPFNDCMHGGSCILNRQNHPINQKKDLNPLKIMKKEFPGYIREQAILDPQTRSAYGDVGLALTAGSLTPCSVVCGIGAFFVDARLVIDSIYQNNGRLTTTQLVPYGTQLLTSKAVRVSGYTKYQNQAGVGAAIATGLTIRNDYHE